MILGYSIALIMLIAFSAFFSSSETAFLSLDIIMIRQMAKEKTKSTKRVISLKKNMDNLLTTILIGNNVVNNLSSSIGTALAIVIFGQKGTGIATIFMSIFIIIAGEIVPKTIASYAPQKTAKFAAKGLFVLEKLLYPFIKIFTLLNKGVNRLEEKIWNEEVPLVTEEELKELFEISNQEGTLENGEKDMLYKIFEFTDLRVKDIMKHRSRITAMPYNSTYSEIVAKFTESGCTRLPIYQNSLDNICGLLHYKDLLFYSGDTTTFDISTVLRKVLFIPETKSAVSLLHQFKTEKQNFAIVIGEHGSLSGIISLDDILKAVFGRITDEYTETDVAAEERIEIINKNSFRIPGDLPLTIINEIFSLQLESQNFDTFGGWLLEEFDYLPSTGETLRRNNLVFTVEDQAQRRIKSIRLTFLQGEVKIKKIHVDKKG